MFKWKASSLYQVDWCMLTLTRAKHRPIICIETKYEENGWILKREREMVSVWERVREREWESEWESESEREGQRERQRERETERKRDRDREEVGECMSLLIGLRNVRTDRLTIFRPCWCKESRISIPRHLPKSWVNRATKTA